MSLPQLLIEKPVKTVGILKSSVCEGNEKLQAAKLHLKTSFPTKLLNIWLSLFLIGGCVCVCYLEHILYSHPDVLSGIEISLRLI